MKTLIVYSSKYGTIEECVKKISKKVSGEVRLSNINLESSIDISDFDVVLIGSSIYFGNASGKIRRFVNHNQEKLQNKKVGIFITCFEGGDKVEKHFQKAYPKWLLDHAFTKIRLGYEFHLEKMSFIDKFVTKNLIKVKKNTSNLFDKNINKLIEEQNSLT